MSLMNNFQRRGPYTFQIPTIGSQYLLNAESSQFKQSLIYLYVASKNIFLVFDWGPPHSCGKIDAGYIFRDFARFFVSSDWPQCILRKDDRALVKFPSE